MKRKLEEIIKELNDIRSELVVLQKEEQDLEKEGIQILGETQILCPECTEQSALKELDFFRKDMRFWVVCQKCERNFPISLPILKHIAENMGKINHLRFDELFNRRLIKV